MMFVSRRRYDEAEARVAALVKQVFAEQAKADAAEDQIKWLRAQIEQTQVKSVPPVKSRDEVLEVIADVAGTNGALRKELGKFVRNERRKGEKDADIIKVLLHWPDASEWSPEE